MWVLRKEKKGERHGFGLKPQQERDSFSSVFNYLIDLWFGSPNAWQASYTNVLLVCLRKLYVNTIINMG